MQTNAFSTVNEAGNWHVLERDRDKGSDQVHHITCYLLSPVSTSHEQDQQLVKAYRKHILARNCVHLFHSVFPTTDES